MVRSRRFIFSLFAVCALSAAVLSADRLLPETLREARAHPDTVTTQLVQPVTGQHAEGVPMSLPAIHAAKVYGTGNTLDPDTMILAALEADQDRNPPPRFDYISRHVVRERAAPPAGSTSPSQTDRHRRLVDPVNWRGPSQTNAIDLIQWKRLE